MITHHSAPLFSFANVLTIFTTYRLSGNNTDDSDAENTSVVKIESICILICIVIGLDNFVLDNSLE